MYILYVCVFMAICSMLTAGHTQLGPSKVTKRPRVLVAPAAAVSTGTTPLYGTVNKTSNDGAVALWIF